jgi:hypothetical protein
MYVLLAVGKHFSVTARDVDDTPVQPIPLALEECLDHLFDKGILPQAMRAPDRRPNAVMVDVFGPGGFSRGHTESKVFSRPIAVVNVRATVGMTASSNCEKVKNTNFGSSSRRRERETTNFQLRQGSVLLNQAPCHAELFTEVMPCTEQACTLTFRHTGGV